METTRPGAQIRGQELQRPGGGGKGTPSKHGSVAKTGTVGRMNTRHRAGMANVTSGGLGRFRGERDGRMDVVIYLV